MKTEIEDGTSDINHRIDTLVGNNIHDTLVSYTIKNCADVTACVKTEIEDGTSDINHRIDTLVANNIHDSLAEYKIKDCADVKGCVAEQIHDTIAAHTISNATITINTSNGTLVGDFTLNQATAETIVLPVIPDAANDSKITIVDGEGNTVGDFTLDQATAKTITLPSYSQKSVRTTATASQTGFALTVPSGKALETTNHLVQMYINGVYVGDTTDGVVTVSGTTATYVPASNGGYALEAGDRVQFVYWVK